MEDKRTNFRILRHQKVQHTWKVHAFFGPHRRNQRNFVPEHAINAGWRDIAFKIKGFINTTPQCIVKQHSKPTITYARVVERSKWKQQSHKEASASIEGPLGRSITGLFEGSERPTPTDVRKWDSSTWKKSFGVDIYEMAWHIFLFEFPNKHMAEQILQGEWNWKNMKVKLEW
ncbi:hypothetical protein MTR67_031564 [Solanum verrucosum]|uniref:DUF4283 domain-containing protein n=1 Tax=Solanum verrucosum TaxID=315347 RepID=A0AAF0ZHT6_SOLVR|nr:hypothetical protein MTR67_031564 [Solanum verrucosum]